MNPAFVPKDCGIVIDEPDPPPIDLDPFRRRKANLLRGVSHFVSASASAFTPATDELTGDTNEPYATLPEATRWGFCSSAREMNGRAPNKHNETELRYKFRFNKRRRGISGPQKQLPSPKRISNIGDDC